MALNSVMGRMCKGKEAVMGGRTGVLRTSLGVVLLAGFICFLFVGISVNQTTRLNTIAVPSTRNFNTLKFIRTEEKNIVHRDFDLSYVSKRRVPNGPDPIHNRRTGNTGRPTGRA